jgi:hypothetical protein
MEYQDDFLDSALKRFITILFHSYIASSESEP